MPDPESQTAPQPPAPGATVEDEFPDPDEDDLDDLDDMLDDFSTMKVERPEPAPAVASPATTPRPARTMSSEEPSLEDMMDDEDFANELEANMASLFGNTDMQSQLKTLFDQISAEADTVVPPDNASPIPAGARSPPPPPSSSRSPQPAPSENTEAFQNSINETIKRLAQSNQKATEATTTSSGDPTADDLMAAMLQHLQEGAGAGGGGDGAGRGGEAGEEDFSKLLLGMMEELTNKEILYEPMKELDDKFPKWLEENGSRTSAGDLNRYVEQQGIVRDIVARFESKTYSDSNAADREYVVDKMQKMQAAGAPPPDLVGDMSSAQEMLSMEEGCNPQ